MKSFLILIILFFVQNINSQFILKGRFVLDIKSPMHGEQYTFRNDGTFEYYEWVDLLPNDYGRGNYEIQDSILLLDFIDIPEMHDTLLYIEKEYETIDDTIIYNFKILDFKDKTPDIYSVVRLRFSGKFMLDTNIFFPDSNGCTEIKFPKNKQPYSILISSLGGGKNEYIINDFKSRNIRVYLKNLNVLLDYIGPKLEKIQIRKITDERFELYKYKQWCPYVKYSK